MENQMTNLEKAQEMMLIPIKDLPKAAQKYAEFLCARYGMCMEVLLTAWAHYAECCENYTKCDDVAYQADDYAKAFFAGYKAAGN